MDIQDDATIQTFIKNKVIKNGENMRKLNVEDIFNAMQQEMKRTLSLQIDKEAKIHFVAFKVSDFSFLSITAFMGGLISSKQGNYITTDVMLRVGNQKEDSSFFNADTYATSFQQSSSF